MRQKPGITVWRVGDEDAPARGTKDPDILRWCEANDFVLISDNRGTMPGHLRDHLADGGHVPGIIWLRGNASLGAIVDYLILIAGAATPDDFRDQIKVIPF
jgi:hypothetical protein